MNPTIKKIILFLGIILIGIIGLMVADQYDFINGRTDNQISIGNGIPDPLVSSEERTTQSVEKSEPNKKTDGSVSGTLPKKPSTASVSNIDGVQKTEQ
jgi:DNA/RNA endonuclease YhcR with UshA esterase domain